MTDFELASGYKMPALGLGTWRMTGAACTQAVRAALEMGYEQIDTADAYGNHRAIARALEGINADNVFITSKIWRNDLRHEGVLDMCDRALAELGVHHLDLLLIHWPSSRVPVGETLSAMAELVERGKVHSIGVSNFSIDHLEEALDVTEVPIAVNQVEYHPYNNQEDLLAFCKRNNIVVTAYSPFGSGRLIGDTALKRIAAKAGKSVPQVILKWLLTKGMVVIPKAARREHIAANMDIFDWELDAQDLQVIDSLDRR